MLLYFSQSLRSFWKQILWAPSDCLTKVLHFGKPWEGLRHFVFCILCFYFGFIKKPKGKVSNWTLIQEKSSIINRIKADVGKLCVATRGDPGGAAYAERYKVLLMGSGQANYQGLNQKLSRCPSFSGYIPLFDRKKRIIGIEPWRELNGTIFLGKYGITHRCHKQGFLLKFTRDNKRWLQWLYEARRRYGLVVLDHAITSNHICRLQKDGWVFGKEKRRSLGDWVWRSWGRIWPEMLTGNSRLYP